MSGGRYLALSIGAVLILRGASGSGPTFSKDVAPILFQRCAGCHRPGDVAPMSLLDYKSVRLWAQAIREATKLRKMPPWFADPRYGHFANDPRLSEAEIRTIAEWVQSGAPEGDPRDLPAPPVFADGWRLGKPDIVVVIDEQVLKPGEDRYVTLTVPWQSEARHLGARGGVEAWQSQGGTSCSRKSGVARRSGGSGDSQGAQCDVAVHGD